MKRSWLSWFAVLAMMMMLFAVTGCSDDDDENGGGTTPFDVSGAIMAAGDEYFDEYKIEFPEGSDTWHGVNVPANTAFDNIAKNPDHYYIVDMRSGDDFAWAHIEGAVNVSMGNLVAEIDNMPTDRMILVGCYTGQTASYATAIINLIGTETGHRAQNLKFGASGMFPASLVKDTGTYSYPHANDNILDMVNTASPDKNTAGDYPALDDDANNAEEALKARAAVAASAWVAGTSRMLHTDAAKATTDDLYLINYFTPAAYSDGHLPNAILYAPTSGDAGTTCEFLTTESLNTLPTDKPVGVYCYTGQTSAQTAAYLQMLGYSQGKTVLYGIQKMAYDDEAINDVPWHGPEPEDAYLAILEGTAPDLNM